MLGLAANMDPKTATFFFTQRHPTLMQQLLLVPPVIVDSSSPSYPDGLSLLLNDSTLFGHIQSIT